jgi:hypothetical protein
MPLASSGYRMMTLPAAAKAGIVVGGYAVAILLAFSLVSIYINQTGGPARDASAGMYAFGDALLFIAVFGVVSIIPTGLALVFLRQSRTFWVGLSVVALVVASTSLAAVAVVLLAPREGALSTSLSAWALLAVPRILVSPFLAASFGLSALIAPEARFRWYLLGAAGFEGVSSVYGFFHWFAPLFFH